MTFRMKKRTSMVPAALSMTVLMGILAGYGREKGTVVAVNRDQVQVRP